jgi:hypothetical protein
MTMRRPAKAQSTTCRDRDRNAPLVVYFAGCILLNMRRRQLHLDDVRPELSRDLDGIANDIDR